MGEIPRQEEIPEEKPKRKTIQEMRDELMAQSRAQLDTIRQQEVEKLNKMKDSKMAAHAESIARAKEEEKLALERFKKSQEELRKSTEELAKIKKSMGL